MVAKRVILFAGLWLFAGRAVFCLAVPAASLERHDVFRKHWWERREPYMPSAAEQLEYADELRDEGRFRKASRVYRSIVYNWPKSAEAPVAQLNYGYCLERRGLYKDAFKAYQAIVDVYAGFVSYENVIARQLEIANKMAERERRFLFFTYRTPRDAIPFFKKLIRNCPRCEDVAELQYRIGAIYQEDRNYEDAIQAYRKYLQMYPDGSMAEQATFGKADCYYSLAQRMPNDGALRSHARAALEYFIAGYPESEMADRARMRVETLRTRRASACYEEALAYETSAGRTRNKQRVLLLLTAAKTVYERVVREHPGSKWASMAEMRLRHINQRLEKYDEK